MQCSNGDKEEMDNNDMHNHLDKTNKEFNDPSTTDHHITEDMLQPELALDAFGPSTTVTMLVSADQQQ